MVSQNYLFTANVKIFDSENNCQILIKNFLKVFHFKDPKW